MAPATAVKQLASILNATASYPHTRSQGLIQKYACTQCTAGCHAHHSWPSNNINVLTVKRKKVKVKPDTWYSAT